MEFLAKRTRAVRDRLRPIPSSTSTTRVPPPPSALAVPLSPFRYVPCMRATAAATNKWQAGQGVVHGPLPRLTLPSSPPQTLVHSLEEAGGPRQAVPTTKEQPKTTSAHFGRVDLSWTNINYTVQEGKKGSASKKVRSSRQKRGGGIDMDH